MAGDTPSGATPTARESSGEMAAKPAMTRRATARQHPFALVAPMLASALVLGIVGGFALATLLTVTRALNVALGAWWTAAAQAHGHLQLYGWVGLFVLGVACYFVPRLRGAPLAGAGFVPWVLAALVSSLVLRGIAQPLVAATGAGVWRVAFALSAPLEAAALLGAVGMLAATLRAGPPLRSRPALWSILPFVAGAFVALGLAGLVNAANVFAAAATPTGIVPPAGDDLNVTLGLFGFLIPLALAMSARFLPMYAGLDAFPRGMLAPLAGAYLAGLALFAAGTAGGLAPGAWSGIVTGTGMLLVGGALVAFIAVFLKMMPRRGRLPERVTRLAPSAEAAARVYRDRVSSDRGAYGPFVALIASAYTWAAVGGVLLVVDGLASLFGGTPPIALDIARHSLAVGFIALLLCGVSQRMIPGFSGGTIRSPALVLATLWLGNGAAVLRVGAPLLLPLAARAGGVALAVDGIAFGLAGPVGLALACCLAINLWPAVWAKARG
ncbi:MAG TPA: hypothetical protein VIC85_21150 [Ktedonobacterales bacterium]